MNLRILRDNLIRPNYVPCLERGKYVPDPATLERLASILDIPAPYFYTRDDDLARVILGFQKLNRSDNEKILALATTALLAKE